MIKIVQVADRATVVLALRGYAESLKMGLDLGKINPRGVKINPREEIERANRLVQDFTNKFFYLSDDMIAETRGVLSATAWNGIMSELLDLIARDIVILHKPTAPGDDHELEGVPDPDAVIRLRELIHALGGA